MMANLWLVLLNFAAGAPVPFLVRELTHKPKPCGATKASKQASKNTQK